jgi:hypothetical protein
MSKNSGLEGISIVYNVNPLQGSNLDWPEGMKNKSVPKIGFSVFSTVNQNRILFSVTEFRLFERTIQLPASWNPVPKVLTI